MHTIKLPSVLDMLDDVEENSEIDRASLTTMAIFALQFLGIAQARTFKRYAKFPLGTYLITRPQMVQMLEVLRFDEWQSASFVEFLVNKDTTSTDRDFQFQHTNDLKWQRIADLALFSHSMTYFLVPLSNEELDRRMILIQVDDLAHVLRCARYESWSQPGWASCVEVDRMKSVIDKALESSKHS